MSDEKRILIADEEDMTGELIERALSRMDDFKTYTFYHVKDGTKALKFITNYSGGRIEFLLTGLDMHPYNENKNGGIILLEKLETWKGIRPTYIGVLSSQLNDLEDHNLVKGKHYDFTIEKGPTSFIQTLTDTLQKYIDQTKVLKQKCVD